MYVAFFLPVYAVRLHRYGNPCHILYATSIRHHLHLSTCTLWTYAIIYSPSPCTLWTCAIIYTPPLYTQHTQSFIRLKSFTAYVILETSHSATNVQWSHSLEGKDGQVDKQEDRHRQTKFEQTHREREKRQARWMWTEGMPNLQYNNTIRADPWNAMKRWENRDQDVGCSRLSYIWILGYLISTLDKKSGIN